MLISTLFGAQAARAQDADVQIKARAYKQPSRANKWKQPREFVPYQALGFSDGEFVIFVFKDSIYQI